LIDMVKGLGIVLTQGINGRQPKVSGFACMDRFC